MKKNAESLNQVLNISSPPLQSWPNPLFAEKELTVNVLRLDAVHPVLGGNKWMKLRLFLEKARSEKRAGILTKGGPWSNHIHACAWACRQMDLPITAWIKGSAKNPPAMLNDVITWGTSVKYINRELFYDETSAYDFAAENNLLYIPMGGADDAGIQSAREYLEALLLPQSQYAVCATGTATTFGGLAFTQNNFENVIGIEAGTNDPSIKEKLQQWQEALPGKQLFLQTDYTFGGFARYTPELLVFANELFTHYRIPTDIVYTAKLFYAVQQMVAKDFFQKGTTILILHSGGLQGNRSLPEGMLQF